MHFPSYEPWIATLPDRFVDLWDVFKNYSYYHPRQNGETGLKAVLPALTTTSYDGLEITEGGAASEEFLRVTFSDVRSEERARVRRALEAYCRQDTQAMIDILAALETLCRLAPA